MSKTNADSDSAYADFLTATIEENKSSFTEDELKTLESDIETIRGIEEQISKLEDELATTGSADTEDVMMRILHLKIFPEQTSTEIKWMELCFLTMP